MCEYRSLGRNTKSALEGQKKVTELERSRRCSRPCSSQQIRRVIPNSVERSGEPENCSLTPADELFYKGQLLPLLLPFRLKKVQELSNKEASVSNISPSEADDDAKDHDISQSESYTLSVISNDELHAKICISASESSEDLSSSTLTNNEYPAKICGTARESSEELPSSTLYLNLGERMHSKASMIIRVPTDRIAKDRSSNNCSAPVRKPKIRWSSIFRKDVKPSLVDAACCNFTRTTSGHRNKPTEVEYIAVESNVCTLQWRDSSDRHVSPKRPRRSFSSLSSSACMHRNLPINSRSLRHYDECLDFDMKGPAGSQKESLILKAKYCLQKPFNLFKLSRLKDEKDQRGVANILKQLHEDQCLNSVHVTKKKSQVAHCEQNNARQSDDDELNTFDNAFEASSFTKNMSLKEYWNLRLTEINGSEMNWPSMMLADEEEDDQCNAAFITIEPDFLQKNENSPFSNLECNASSLRSDGLSTSSRRLDSCYDHESIQSAIAHCKASA
ncbi:hypothetical protein KP509_13G084300 [Ceratopteris richardii]|uniref:Uncharacterized protein n=1 Tax=Ceratopteris richardii TaxID=49495 RepID=A0A8T2TKK8_CERRI|nr:hypothetical protein KP509_13G084300 [Ceratopteris richardii]